MLEKEYGISLKIDAVARHIATRLNPFREEVEKQKSGKAIKLLSRDIGEDIIKSLIDQAKFKLE